MEIDSSVKSKILDSLENTSYSDKFRALKVELEKVEEDDQLELRLNEQLGLEAKLLDRGVESYKYFTRMLYLGEKLGDSTAIANACFNIGNRIRLGNVEDKPYQPYFQRAINIYQSSSSPIEQGCSLYLQLLLADSTATKFQLALDAIELLERNLDSTDFETMEVLARHYNVAGLYSEDSQSFNYLEKGLAAAQGSENHLMSVFILNNMAYDFQMRGHFQEAISYYHQGLDVALNVGLKNLASNSLHNLTNCYRRLNDFEQAFLYHNAMVSMRFSILDDNYFNSLAKEKVTHEVDRIELRNSLLLAEQNLQKKQRMFLLIFLLVLFLIATYIFWSRRKLNLANQKLQALDKVKSRFFANISHELRTPITLINGPVERLVTDDQWSMPGAVRDQLQIVKNNGERLLMLVNEILDLTKLEAGKLELKENPLKLSIFMSELLAAYQNEVSSRNIQFRFENECSADLSILADEAKLAKIINNLLSNAFKFTSDGGEIIVKVAAVDEQLKIVVSDSGEGIHPDDVSRVFERFFQSGQASTKASGGTGIGLALSQELAKLHRGGIKVSSQLGKGSEFTLTIPLKEATVSIQDAVSESDEANQIVEILDQTIVKYQEVFKVEKPVLLLTEDHQEMREFVSTILSPFFEVKEASDGLQALDLLSTTKVDMIVSDVMMPRMDGFELLEKIKANDQTKNISMIMLTARAAEEDKLFALTLGVDDYLTKPFSRDELLVRARNILENRMVRERSDDDVSDVDSVFLNELRVMVEKHIRDSFLTVTYLASELAISERQLLRKIKAKTGLTPVQLIKEIRLHKAKKLLETSQVDSVSQAAYQVGFDQAEYFSKQFVLRFGKRPSAFISNRA
ncbi:MAG: response regulator [Cyclobacteriaceae bacterium]